MLLATFVLVTLEDLLSTPVSFSLDDLLSAPVLSSTLDDLLSAPDSAPVFDFFADFAPPPPPPPPPFPSSLDDLEEYAGASSMISPECPDISPECSEILAVPLSVLDFLSIPSLTALDSLTVLEEMDKDEGRTRILDDLEEEETYKEVERLSAFDDFAVIDPSLTEENEEIMVFPALGRGGSLKMRYALEEVVVAVAVAMVARRREMLKFMVMLVN